MAEQFGWKKRTTLTLECPSGAKCVVRRPGPHVGLRGGALMTVLQQKLAPQEGEDNSFKSVLERMERLSDDEMGRLMVFAREVVMAALVQPKLVARPSPGIEDEIGPDDIPFADFWHIFNWATTGAIGIPVQMKGGEMVSVEAIQNFPEQPAASAEAGADGAELPTAAVTNNGDS